MRFRLAFALALACLLAACNKSQPAGEPKGVPAPGASFQVALRVLPNPPKYNQDTTFRVTLKDSAGRPVEGASVSADLVMPEMAMGENKVALADLGRGEYEGVGRFSMGGNYRVVISAYKAGATAKVIFNVTVEL